MKTAIEVRNIRKERQGQPVLRRCSFSVREGEIYGLVGVNGAGKTTLMKIIAGWMKPEEGETVVCGMDSQTARTEIQRHIGSLIEMPLFYEHLSAAENLEIHLAYMGGGGSVQKALKTVGLETAAQKRVSRFSLGMKQRLAIARAVIHRPEVLLLDEPLNGLDPVGMQDLSHMLRNLSAGGTAILVSSHILREMKQLADKIGVLSGGEICEEVCMTAAIREDSGAFEAQMLKKMRRNNQ